MNFEMITEGLKQLLQENNYSSATIRFYEGEWNKIQCFLTEEYGNTEYDMERGLKYLEKQYGFITKYNNGTLSQQRVQLLRVVHMLEDYRFPNCLHLEYIVTSVSPKLATSGAATPYWMRFPLINLYALLGVPFVLPAHNQGVSYAP